MIRCQIAEYCLKYCCLVDRTMTSRFLLVCPRLQLTYKLRNVGVVGGWVNSPFVYGWAGGIILPFVYGWMGVSIPPFIYGWVNTTDYVWTGDSISPYLYIWVVGSIFVYGFAGWSNNTIHVGMSDRVNTTIHVWVSGCVNTTIHVGGWLVRNHYSCGWVDGSIPPFVYGRAGGLIPSFAVGPITSVVYKCVCVM